MDVTGVRLRKASLKAGGLAAGFSVAMGAGMAMALHQQGQDPGAGLQAAAPVFVGATAVRAGVHPVRTPSLFVSVMAAAAARTALVQTVVLRSTWADGGMEGIQRRAFHAEEVPQTLAAGSLIEVAEEA